MLTQTGTLKQKVRILHEFTEGGEDAARILVLSLKEAASGTNLFIANHVIFVHPMLCNNSEEARRYELQAIGRVRRFGQTKKVHIHRYVTADTIEEELVKRISPHVFQENSTLQDGQAPGSTKPFQGTKRFACTSEAKQSKRAKHGA